jgi:hypothetical protein
MHQTLPRRPQPSPLALACLRAAGALVVLGIVGSPASWGARDAGSARAQPIPTATSAGADTWPTYRNELAGYSVEYPPEWIVEEGAEPDGSLVAAFKPPDGSPGVTVIARAVQPDALESSDVPNLRCRPATSGGLAGIRCFDTIAGTQSTTLFAPGRAYVIAASVRRLDPAIYDRMLASFQLLPAPTLGRERVGDPVSHAGG